MIGYGMEIFDDAHATFLREARSLDHGIGHIHHILLRAHQHLELGGTTKSWRISTDLFYY